MFRVIYDCLRTCNLNFFIAFSCFSCDRTISPGIGICGKEENNTFVLPHYRRHIFMLHFRGLPPFQFQDSWFPKSFSLLPTGKECLGPDQFSYFSNSLKFVVLIHFRCGVFGPLVRVLPSSFVSELSSNCPSSSLSVSLPSSSSSDENIVT